MRVSFPAPNTKKKPLNRVAFFCLRFMKRDLGLSFHFLPVPWGSSPDTGVYAVNA